MPHRFDPDNLELRLRRLPERARLAFGALLLDRAVPNFLQFAAETGAPGGPMLRGAHAKIWGTLEGVGAATPFQGIDARLCEAIAPDTELYQSLYTSSALDAVSICCDVLEFIDSGKIELLVDAASLRRDSIDIFLQLNEQADSHSPDFEARLLNHPLMQTELRLQNEDLELLERCQSDGQQVWTMALRRSVDLGYSQFSLRIESM